jgi:hypothetical protein
MSKDPGNLSIGYFADLEVITLLRIFMVISVKGKVLGTSSASPQACKQPLFRKAS